MAILSTACGGGGPSGPDFQDHSGPLFSVSPMPLETIHQISPVGSNNKIFPVGHTYWLSCDEQLSWGGTPEEQAANPDCHLERQVLVAPGPGVVRWVNPAEDGAVTVTTPGGNYDWTMGHVTPLVTEGTRVTAGQPVARMLYRHGFDFGVLQVKGGKVNGLANPERFPPYPPVHPISLYGEPLRTQLINFVPTVEGDKLGKQHWDVPGTAMGAWFLEGAPAGNLLGPHGVPYNLYFGRFTLRQSVRFVAVGRPWPGQVNQTLTLDPAGRDWEAITPASGRVAQRMWHGTQTGLVTQFEWPAGTIVVEMLAADRLRIEWFDTHEPVTEFTAASRVYIR